MVDQDCRAWQGVVEAGELKGYRLEVRRQRFPWTLFVLAFTAPDHQEEPIVGFAVGRLQLAEHLQKLGTEVTWADGRGPLAPERDHIQHRIRRHHLKRLPSQRPPRLGQRRPTQQAAGACSTEAHRTSPSILT